MPLLIYQSNSNNTGRLLVWKAYESTPELEAMVRFTPELKGQYEKQLLEKRRREWLVTRILLQLVAPDHQLKFAATGKPYLEGNLHISISHCGELAGLLIAEHNVGLDIQGVDEKLEKISKKFCNEKELKTVSSVSQPLEFLTVIWSAKEAIFKYFGEQVHFAKDIQVRPFQPLQEIIKAEYTGIHGKQVFELQHVSLRGYHIVMTL